VELSITGPLYVRLFAASSSDPKKMQRRQAMSNEKIYTTLGDDSCVSHFNFEKAALEEYDLPEKIFIRDTTLREGEQGTMSGFSTEERIEIAKMLDEAGVHYIEVGFPGFSESENKMIRKLAALGLRAKVGGLCLPYLPEWREQINQAFETGMQWVSIGYGLSPVRLNQMMKIQLEEAITICLKATEYATKKGLFVLFGATDTTRTPLATLVDLYRKAVSAGASTVSISDTAGAIGPTGMRYLVREIKKAVNVPVRVHCHNDLGLALANSISAVEAGASIVDVTVNGLGERAGNACLDEVATVLTYLYGYDLGINIKKLLPLSKRVAELSRIPIAPRKPIIGESAFTHTLGAHQWGVRQAWFVFEPVRAEALGSERKLPLGRLTHALLVRDKLEERGFTDLDEDTIKTITEKVRCLAEKERRFVTDEELLELARSERG
jgi:2-isopropylmalate synthase